MRRNIYRQAADRIGGAYRRYRRGQGILTAPNTQRSISSQLPAFGARMAAAAVAGVAARRALTQTRRVGRQVPAGGGGESLSRFSLRNPKPKLGKDWATNTIVRSLGFSQSSTQGLQSVQTIGSYFNASDIYDAFTQTVGNADDDAGCRLFFEKMRGQALITNAESTNVHMTLYDVLAKTDGQATHNVDPSNCMAVSGVDASGGAAANYSVPGVEFDFNPRVRAFYKVLQRTVVTLGPGQTHNHYVEYDCNKWISQERIRALAATSTTYPVGGVSLYTVIVHHGTPVHDATTETSVTLGLSKLDIVLKEQYTVRWIGAINPKNTIVTSLATNLTGEQMIPDAPVDGPDTS